MIAAQANVDAERIKRKIERSEDISSPPCCWEIGDLCRLIARSFSDRWNVSLQRPASGAPQFFENIRYVYSI
ncbi:MAG: hypothetical protein ACKVKF_08745 [Rhodobacterales bacterium]|uniref:hypothetical protein n=1 Tax=Puniceibacterium antarcticum TaxID=1206336 RepID=UPI00117B54E6|nr:hypothetical protein [Puniceibacterium antarcticum]